MPVQIDITAPDLFANEAAEDEREDVFRSILVERPEIRQFSNPLAPIQVVSAYKGEGKSALLRSLRHSLEESPDAIVIATTGIAAGPRHSGGNSVEWSRCWKESLYGLVAAEVGARLGGAWNDDTIGLVEEAEKQGFRRRNFFSAMKDRLKVTIGIGSEDAAGLSVSHERQGPPSVSAALRRTDPKGDTPIWLIVDDVDKNFKNATEDRARVVGFFDAIRDMCNAVPQLRVRTAIRPNVYAVISLHYESLSHIRQYIVQVSWEEAEVKELLLRRIEGYLRRSAQWDAFVRSARTGNRSMDERLLDLVFESPVQWGRGTRPIHVPIYTLCAHRPRWAVELCKAAAKRASRAGVTRIRLADINAAMGSFGANRRSDMIAEFRPQCKVLAELIDAFEGQYEEYTTGELIQLIDTRILGKLNPQIAGVAGRPTAHDVASYLFECGLFFGRRDSVGGRYEHTAFAQRPHALASRTAEDDDIIWEIHPVYRQALRLRDKTGAVVSKS